MVIKKKFLLKWSETLTCYQELKKELAEIKSILKRKTGLDKELKKTIDTIKKILFDKAFLYVDTSILDILSQTKISRNDAHTILESIRKFSIEQQKKFAEVIRLLELLKGVANQMSAKMKKESRNAFVRHEWECRLEEIDRNLAGFRGIKGLQLLNHLIESVQNIRSLLNLAGDTKKSDEDEETSSLNKLSGSSEKTDSRTRNTFSPIIELREIQSPPQHINTNVVNSDSQSPPVNVNIQQASLGHNIIQFVQSASVQRLQRTSIENILHIQYSRQNSVNSSSTDNSDESPQESSLNDSLNQSHTEDILSQVGGTPMADNPEEKGPETTLDLSNQSKTENPMSPDGGTPMADNPEEKGPETTLGDKNEAAPQTRIGNDPTQVTKDPNDDTTAQIPDNGCQETPRSDDQMFDHSSQEAGEVASDHKKEITAQIESREDSSKVLQDQEADEAPPVSGAENPRSLPENAQDSGSVPTGKSQVKDLGELSDEETKNDVSKKKVETIKSKKILEKNVMRAENIINQDDILNKGHSTSAGKDYNVNKQKVKPLHVPAIDECKAEEIVALLEEFMKLVAANQPGCIIDQLEILDSEIKKEHLMMFLKRIQHLVCQIQKLSIGFTSHGVGDLISYCCKIVDKCNIRTLSLQYNGLQDVDINSLHNCLAEDKELDEINISHNEKISPVGFYQLGKILVEHHVKIFRAADCNISDDQLEQLTKGMKEASKERAPRTNTDKVSAQRLNQTKHKEKEESKSAMSFKDTTGLEDSVQISVPEQTVRTATRARTGFSDEDISELLAKSGQHMQLQELDISFSRNLSSKGFGHLAELVRNKGVKKLKLSGFQLTAEKLEAFYGNLKLRKAVAGQATREVLLEELEVSYNPSMEPEAYKTLGLMVKVCGVKKLSLAGCGLNENHLKYLREQTKKHKMVSLDAADNSSIGEGIIEIAFIVGESNLEELNISQCMLSAAELRNFREALGEAKLQCLNLSDFERDPDESYVTEVCKVLSSVTKKLILKWGRKTLFRHFRIKLQNALDDTKSELQIVLNEKEEDILYCDR